MPTIYISDSGDDKNDGLSLALRQNANYPIWVRLLGLAFGPPENKESSSWHAVRVPNRLFSELGVLVDYLEAGAVTLSPFDKLWSAPVAKFPTHGRHAIDVSRRWAPEKSPARRSVPASPRWRPMVAFARTEMTMPAAIGVPIRTAMPSMNLHEIGAVGLRKRRRCHCSGRRKYEP
jgi:hypothetical protein